MKISEPKTKSLTKQMVPYFKKYSHWPWVLLPALPPRVCPLPLFDSSFSASSYLTSSYLSSLLSSLNYLGASLDHLSSSSHHFGLMPFTLRVQQLPPVTGDERALLDKL